MEIHKVACVGAGLIGQGWAALFSSKGLDVSLHDLTQEILEKSLIQIGASLEFLETHNLMKPGEAKAARKLIRTTTDIASAVADADYVQESVPDSYEIKKRVFQQLDAAAPPQAILASSASGLLMTEIQKVAMRPERCVLAHPVLPAHLIPLVEIVGGEYTAPETVARTRELMETIGKTPVVLNREVPGYIVNRLQAALLREAIDLVDKGVAGASDVDKAFCMGIGLRDPLMGPFLRMHVAGGSIDRFIENYSRSYQDRWESMETWTSIPSSAANTVIRQVSEMEVVRTKALEDIRTWRDEMLVKILNIVRKGNGGVNP